jgi:hypothetical protein
MNPSFAMLGWELEHNMSKTLKKMSRKNAEQFF